MELLQKFAAVEIQADRRITESDKQYCERHQEAYETAIGHYKELAFFWDDMKKAQRKLLGEESSSFYHNYLDSSEGPTISRYSIDKHIEGLHADFIANLTRYFNSTYSVSVSSTDVSDAILPEKPKDRWHDKFEEMGKKYHAQMQSLIVRYQDVVDQIILRLEGRSFSEQAFHELYTKCHNAAWNTYKQEPQFEQKKDTIRFTGYFCNFRGWPYDGWELDTKMQDILRGVAHYDTGSHGILPAGFSRLMGYHDIKEDVVQFPSCGKIMQMKLFKNNRVDLKFSAPEFAEEFINTYLGTVC